MKQVNRDNYYIQTNNPTEVALKTYGTEWLVSCGPTAMINCIAPLGYDTEMRSPTGLWVFQPEECVMDFLLDPRNKAKLNSIRNLPDDIAKNEVPQYYPYAASVLFGATAKFEFGRDWGKLRHFLERGTVQLCLKKPGHYIAAVKPGVDCIYYNDSWPGRHLDGNGYLVEMKKDEFEENVKEYAIWYMP